MPPQRAQATERDGGMKEDEACQRCRLLRVWRAGPLTAGNRKREPEEERMVGDRKRKAGGTEIPTVFFRPLLCIYKYSKKKKIPFCFFFFSIWHVVSLTDSRPGDRVGWLVLCGSSGGGHSSAVSALTEIPTP